MPSSGLLHITHWKAGSQWIRQVLEQLFAPRIVAPEPQEAQFLDRPLNTAAVYPTVYVSKWQFDSVPQADAMRRFVVIRDLRDTLVSMYFSFRGVHAVHTHRQATVRAALLSLPPESGLVYLTETVLEYCALIQRSWLDSGERLYRYEDLIQADVDTFRSMIVESGGQPVPDDKIHAVVESRRFERVTGRARGVEDVGSHDRKGVAGDWKNHFSRRVRESFGRRYGDLVVQTGYEKDPDWWKSPPAA